MRLPLRLILSVEIALLAVIMAACASISKHDGSAAMTNEGSSCDRSCVRTYLSETRIIFAELYSCLIDCHGDARCEDSCGILDPVTKALKKFEKCGDSCRGCVKKRFGCTSACGHDKNCEIECVAAESTCLGIRPCTDNCLDASHSCSAHCGEGDWGCFAKCDDMRYCCLVQCYKK